MHLFAPYLTIPLTMLSAWLGIRAGGTLRARGFTLRQHLKFKDLPRGSVVLPAMILLVPPFMLLRKDPELYWYLPLIVQVYEGGLLWGLVLCCFLYVLGMICGVQFGASPRTALLALLVAASCAGAAEYGIRQSPFLQRPNLGAPRVVDGVIRQTDGASCAAASAANMACRLGIPRTEAEMAELMGTTSFGTNVSQVYEGMRQLGFHSVARRITDRDFTKLHAPAFLFVDVGNEALGHAVCYMGEVNGAAEVWDPLGGKSFQSRESLASRWRGHALEVYR